MIRPWRWVIWWGLVMAWALTVSVTAPPAPLPLLVLAVYAATLPVIWPRRSGVRPVPGVVSPRPPLITRIQRWSAVQALEAGEPISPAQSRLLAALVCGLAREHGLRVTPPA
ncbi:hypothetical protein [uncultured Deinococcus sp.]|uniref:hypothetical protein n=1 Tax=uncultured Deinococcus sp. TaxID=158789 RepID=UPI0025EE41BB|nr:hypothetical protein [uncultured Deinococcus sp.]